MKQDSQQWRSQPKNLGGQKFGGVKMFDFRRITLFCLEKRLFKAQNGYIFKKIGGHGPSGPPGYACDSQRNLSVIRKTQFQKTNIATSFIVENHNDAVAGNN